MESESQCGALESVRDNDLTTANNLGRDSPDHNNDTNNFKLNGSCPNERIQDVISRENDTNALPQENHVKESVDIQQAGKSSPLSIKSSTGASPPSTKGFGLKKWKRIRRDFVKENSGNLDSGKVVSKRAFSVPGNPAKKSINSTPAELNHNSQGSVGSINVLRNVGVVDGFVSDRPNLESKSVVGHAFASGTDSENGEDRSIKPSTATRATRMRYDLPSLGGSSQDKNKTKGLGGKSAVASTQRAQQGKGMVESSKKPRGERVKIEKENSHSSMESDSRSSNFVFTQGAHFVTSNGTQSGSSMNYDGGNSDEAHAVEQHFSEEDQAGYLPENVAGIDDLSQDEVAAEASCGKEEEKSENQQYSSGQDPLVESILTLQSVQRALESEVQKLGEIGKVSKLEDSSSSDPEIPELHSSEQFDSEHIIQSSSLEPQVLMLTENVKFLESCLGMAKAMLKAKESRIAELEAALNMEGSAKATELQQGQLRDEETEFEGLFKQKIEAEVQYLALTRTMQKRRVVAGDQITPLEQQEDLVAGQVHLLGKLGEAESKACLLKEKAEALEKYCGEVSGTEEVLKLQRGVCKGTACFFVQLILLVLVFWLLILQISPRSGAVVPT